jgi:hypothetical protein
MGKDLLNFMWNVEEPVHGLDLRVKVLKKNKQLVNGGKIKTLIDTINPQFLSFQNSNSRKPTCPKSLQITVICWFSLFLMNP